MLKLANLSQLLIFTLCICSAMISCDSNSNQSKAHEIELLKEAKSKAENLDAKDVIPQFEEVLPDSGLMENVNPEEIITDDWNNDSPEAESDD